MEDKTKDTQTSDSFMQDVQQAYVRARQEGMPFWTYEDDTEAVGYLLAAYTAQSAKLATAEAEVAGLRKKLSEGQPTLNIMQEFKEIPGMNGRYLASNDGQVKNARTGQILSQHLNKDGYPRTNLYPIPSHQKPMEIHRLVASAWLPNPSQLPSVNHIDGNKENNNVSNLEWASYSDNLRHAYDTGLKFPSVRPRVITHPNQKRVLKLADNGEVLAEFNPISSAAKSLGVNSSSISSACSSKRGRVKGMIFRFKEEKA